MPPARRILPITPWSAASPWSLQPRPLLVITLALLVFGCGEGMLVNAGLGSAPWTVLAQGAALTSGLNLGLTTFLISVLVLLAWWPLRQRPGLGTLINIVLIALGLGLFVAWVPPPDTLLARALLCAGGIITIGCASALYLSCHLGAGPRDGLMVGLCQVSGWRIGLIRSLLEGSVCLIGWLLGGTVGPGTLAFAFGVGWVLQWALQWLARHAASRNAAGCTPASG